MARTLASKANTVAPGGNYPYGDVKDNSGANDGTNVNKNLLADLIQFFEKLMADAGVVANALPENGANGFQYAQALKILTYDPTSYETTTDLNTAIYRRVYHASVGAANEPVSDSDDGHVYVSYLPTGAIFQLYKKAYSGAGLYYRSRTYLGAWQPWHLITTADDLATAVAAEATARSSADSSLAGAIATEATARGAADTSLQTNITGEAVARANADIALQALFTREVLLTYNFVGSSSDPISIPHGLTPSKIRGVVSLYWKVTGDDNVGADQLNLGNCDVDSTNVNVAVPTGVFASDATVYVVMKYVP
jgi:hypothetical protein